MSVVFAAATQTPSGLQISMLFLFQIIAGLLLADLFKQAVEVLNKSVTTENVLVIAAAAAFIIRLVVDNYIYYADSDMPPVTTFEYAIRIVLLLIDLAAFAIAYDIVHQISEKSLHGSRKVLSLPQVRRVLCGMALIEALHTVWGLINTWLMVRGGATLHAVLVGATQGTTTGRWLVLSLVFAILPLPLIRYLRRKGTATDLKAAVLVATFSGISALTYVLVMKDYYIGRLKP